jgi:hypothetical protein
MLGNLDVDAGDDTWTLEMKDQELASGGRYDRLSFTVSNGQLSAIVSENVLDLIATHSAPYPLADFEGLVSVAQLRTMTNALLEVESTFFENVFGEKLSMSSTSRAVSSFHDSLIAHRMEYAGLLLASALVGMVTMLGVLRLFSPSPKQHSYATVMDQSAMPPRVEIEFEKPLAVARDDLIL